MELLDELRAALADRYTIARELGAGGMATVYLAEDVKHKRNVAIKVLRPELVAAIGSERFLREIEITANLNHPHVLPLLDSGAAVRRYGGTAVESQSEFLYYVMPYVEGESLRARLNRETQLSIEDALKITDQIASALDYAHRRDVIHRDIKPENILLHEGMALVADFGIALAVKEAGGERLTETGLSLGTPAYMSPEQVAGEREIDARSDIYSLACVLYEMLAGQPPFTGATAQVVLARHVTDSVPPITTARSSVPRSVASAITRALGKAPSDRFESVKLFAVALREGAAPTFEAATKTAPDDKSIVVLPFENLSPDPDNAFFADGLTEEIIADLSKVKALRVISRTSAMVLKDSHKDVPTIARELNVRYVLEGSVRRAGNSLRITAQLIDAANDAHLWADKYNGTLDDVFDLQEKLSRNIVDGLKVTLTPDEDRRLAARPIEDVRAHDIWLRARQYTLTLGSEGPERARRLVEEALAIAEDNALLHATLAWVHGVRYSYIVEQEEADAALELAEFHAAWAMRLDPDLAWSHAASAVISTRTGAIQQYVRRAQRALEFERDSHTLAVLAIYLSHAGRIDAARRYADEAAVLDPLTWLTTHPRGLVDVMDGRIASGCAHLRDVYNRIGRGEVWPTFELADATLQTGDENEAARLFNEVATSDAPYYARVSQLYIHALAGERREALELLDTPEVKHLAPRYGRTAQMVSACLAHVGETDRAFEWLERAIERWFTNHRYLGEYERLLAPIRADPRFEALMERAREKERALVV